MQRKGMSRNPSSNRRISWFTGRICRCSRIMPVVVLLVKWLLSYENTHMIQNSMVISSCILRVLVFTPWRRSEPVKRQCLLFQTSCQIVLARGLSIVPADESDWCPCDLVSFYGTSKSEPAVPEEGNFSFLSNMRRILYCIDNNFQITEPGRMR